MELGGSPGFLVCSDGLLGSDPNPFKPSDELSELLVSILHVCHVLMRTFPHLKSTISDD